MANDIDSLMNKAKTDLAAAADLNTLDQIRVQYLGKKGVLTEQLKALKDVAPEQRKEAGQAINKAKQDLQQEIEARKKELQQAELQKKLESETIDVTLPGRGQQTGGLHPITMTIQRIESFFSWPGFCDCGWP